MRARDLLKQRHAAARLDFLGPTLAGQVTFTRATTANHFGADGLMVQDASGAPRFDFSPTLLTPLGVMLEDARTNICLRNSAPGNASWVKTNTTGSNNVQNGPDGTASYGSLTATSANGTCLQTITVVNGSTYVFSIRLKRITGTGSIQITTDGGTTWNTVAVTSTLTRFSQSQTASSTSMVVGVRIVTNFDSIVFGGAQLELGPYATSELSTAGSSTARNVEQASIALPAPFYSDLYFSATIEFQMIGLAASASSRLMRIVGALATNAWLINVDASGNLFVTNTAAGVSQSSGTIANVSTGVHKAAISYGPYGLIGAVDGVLGTTTPVTNPTQLQVGMQSIDFGPASGLASQYLRRFSFWRNAINPDRLALATV